MDMETQIIRVTIITINSSSRINHILLSNNNLVRHMVNLQEPIKAQVLLISLFHHFRIQGPMLVPPVIQLITILLIIRLLVVTRLRITITVKQTRGVKEVMQVMVNNNIRTMLQNLTVFIMLKLLLLHNLSNINNKIINNGQIIIVKRKSHVLLGQKMYLRQVHPIWCLLFLQFPVGILLQAASNWRHLLFHHLGGQNLAYLRCPQCRFEGLYFPYNLISVIVLHAYTCT